MSRFIEELRASEFPDRSSRDLTLAFGKILERDKRDDVFTANPDFAQEYYAIKDEIQRLKRPSLTEELKGSLGSSVDDLQASWYGLGALAAHGARAVGIPGAESARDKLLGLMREQEKEAAEFQPSVGSFTDIKNLSDVGRYATYGLGTIGPSLLQSGVSAGIGTLLGTAMGSTVAPGPGTAGGAVSGFMLGLAEKKLAQKVLSKMMQDGAKNVVLADVAKALPREVVEAEAKRLAQSMGAQVAMAASSMGMEAGSIYKEDPESPWIAAGYGAVAGLLDVLPESLIVSRILGPADAVTKEAAEEARTYLRRFAQQAAVNIPLEASTETAQTLLEIAAAKHGRGESPTSFTADDYTQALNAGIIGSLGGGVMTVPAAIPNPTTRPNPMPAITDRTIEAMPIPDMAGPGGAMEFAGEIPDRELTAVPPAIQREFDVETRPDRFAPADATPYEVGGATGLPGPGRVSPAGDAINQQIRKAGGASPVAPAPAVQLPQSVLNAVENAEEAARAWEMRMEARNNASLSDLPNGEQAAAREFSALPDAQAPVQPGELEQMRPASGAITDAPLGQFIGREVEYFGTRGVLIRDELGNFVVLPPIRGDVGPLPVEVTGTGKDPSMLASEAAITPLEPPNAIPKPAPAVPIIGGPTSPGISRQPSKVPFGDLAPNDLVPRQDINVNIPNVPPAPPPGPAAAPAAPTVVSGAAAGGMPAGAVDQSAAIETPGEETVALVDPTRKFSRAEIIGQRRAVKDLETKAERAAAAITPAPQEDVDETPAEYGDTGFEYSGLDPKKPVTIRDRRAETGEDIDIENVPAGKAEKMFSDRVATYRRILNCLKK